MQIKSLNTFLLNFNNNVCFTSFKKEAYPIVQSKRDCFEKTNITPKLSKQVFENTKDIVTQSLNSNKPKESIVLVRNGNILYSATGSEFDASIPDKTMDEILNSGYGDIIVVHSHTPEDSGITAPLSIADIKNLIYDDEIKCVCAINNKGEYSIMEKSSQKKYDYSLNELIDNKFRAGFVRLFRGKKRSEYTKFLKSLKYESVKKENESRHKYLIRMFSIQEKLDEYYNYAITLKEFPKYTEEFWKNYSKEFGFNYYSNFSF